MKRTLRSWLLVLVVAGVFVWAVMGLFNRQFASGEVYPEYSSMRTDRMGSRLLFDGLQQLPGVTVERNFLPFEFLPRGGATLVLLALNPVNVNWDSDGLIRQVDAFTSRGNRVLIGLRVDMDSVPEADAFVHPGIALPAPKDSKKSKDSKDAKEAKEPPPDPAIHRQWKLKFGVDSTKGNSHPLYFAEAEGWTALDKVDDKVLTVERKQGNGSVAITVGCAEFSNESMVHLNNLRQISRMLGPYQRIIFDEHHFGMVESGSVVGMARKFRLMGLALGLAFCGALFIWRNASGFPPPVAASASQRFSGRTAQAGLLTLLKRHIRAAELVGVCWKEWLSVNRHEVSPDRQKKAEEIVASSAGRPVDAMREIQAVLHAKGEL